MGSGQTTFFGSVGRLIMALPGPSILEAPTSLRGMAVCERHEVRAMYPQVTHIWVGNEVKHLQTQNRMDSPRLRVGGAERTSRNPGSLN